MVGGGWGGDRRVWRGFVAEATERAGGAPRIAVLSVRDGDETEHAAKLVDAVRAAGPIEPVVIAVTEGDAGFSVDVHAAQWGTLARLIAAVEAGLVPNGVAIDEDTEVILQGDMVEVVGTGNAWWVAPADGGVHVRREAGR